MDAAAPEAAPRPRVLVVDDERQNLETFRRAWRREYDVIIADSPHAGLALMAAETFDVVMTDYLMPEMNGAEFVGAARGVQPVAIVMVTGYVDTPEVRVLEESGSLFCVVGKPWERRTIIDVVARAWAHTRALRERAARR